MPSGFLVGGHFEAFIKAQVESGRHRTASEVVREALRRYEMELSEVDTRLDDLRVIASEGRAALERGDYVSLTTPEAITDLIEALSEDAAREVKEERTAARRD